MLLIKKHTPQHTDNNTKVYAYWGEGGISKGENINFSLGADGKVYRTHAPIMQEGVCLHAMALSDIAPGDLVVFYERKND